ARRQGGAEREPRGEGRDETGREQRARQPSSQRPGWLGPVRPHDRSGRSGRGMHGVHLRCEGRGAARPRFGGQRRGGGVAGRGRAGGARDRDQSDGSLRRRSQNRAPAPPRNIAPTPMAAIGSTREDVVGFSSATVLAFSWLTRGLPATLAAAGLMPEPEPVTSEPDQGSATYGNVPPNALSLALTASPSAGIFAPSSLPSTTWSEMSTTSSVSRR